MSNSILYVLQYFSQFSYPPTIDEVYSYLNSKKNEREFKNELELLISKGIIVKKENRITQSELHFNIFKERELNSQYLLKKALPLLKKLSYLPTIKFIGISGSLSMLNTSKEGDIDLFVITSNNAIWQTRFLILIYKYILFISDRNIASKFCFNLFFSEEGLLLPNEKHNEYIAHEILQLKPLINKENIYERLLFKNKWIQKQFPQVVIEEFKYNNKFLQQPIYVNVLESLLSKIQVAWLRKNGYSWKYKDQQLWLIQEDFQKIVLYNNAK